MDTISGTLSNTILVHNHGCPCCTRFASEPQFVVCTPEVEQLTPDFNVDATVLVSEPVMVAYRTGGKEHVVFERAAKFDSSFPELVSEDPGSVELEVRASIPLPYPYNWCSRAAAKHN